jgi:shikimate kinase
VARKDGENITQTVKNIYLAGFMCSGKTLAGRALAKLLGRPLRDSDVIFEKAAGVKIADFVKAKGLAAFRRAEAGVIGRLAAEKGLVVALGGGFYPSGKRAPLLKRSGITVFLYCPWPELEKRLKAARGPRPLLAGPWAKISARAGRLYAARLPYYRRADITVNVSGATPVAAAARIKKALK